MKSPLCYGCIFCGRNVSSVVWDLWFGDSWNCFFSFPLTWPLRASDGVGSTWSLQGQCAIQTLMGRMGKKENYVRHIREFHKFSVVMFLCVLVTFIFMIYFSCRYCDYRNLLILGILINFKAKISGKKTQNLYIKEGANKVKGIFRIMSGERNR